MTTGSTALRGARIAAALLVLTFAVNGCGRPPDEAWLRFLGFKDGASTLTVLEGALNDGKTDTVDAVFKNASITVGVSNGGAGTGILVTSARIDYRMSGFSPPDAAYPLNLYLGPSSQTDGAAAVNGGTEGQTRLPLATASLKQWLINTHAFNDSSATPTVELTADVTFFAETDEGSKLEVHGSITILLAVSGSAASVPTVNVFFKSNAAKPSTNGAFRVFRTGSLAGAVAVSFSTAGTAIPDTDYDTLGGAVTIPAGLDSAAITVIPRAGGTAVDTTVIISLTRNSAYTLDTHITDTLTITHD